jgi:hypothetical protein
VAAGSPDGEAVASATVGAPVVNAPLGAAEGAPVRTGPAIVGARVVGP